VRKWRPRHLELCADGTLRYYECEATAPTSPERQGAMHAAATAAADADAAAEPNDATGDEILDGWQTLTRADISPDRRRAADDKSARNGSSYVNAYGHRPKATMLVLHARAIDPTSMKDLHVGFPAGRFGFIFRGRALLSSPAKGSPALLADETTNAGRGRTTDTDDGGVQESSRDVARDYFCYVNTAEEADAWIVALRWAATMTKLSDRAALTCSIGSLTSSGGAAPSTSANGSSDAIIITSVRSQKTAWRSMAMPESCFEIRTLLLQRSAENATIAARGEERIVHRSCAELLCLIADLLRDCRADSHSKQVLERVQERALALNQMCAWKQPLWFCGLASPNPESHQCDEIIRSLSRNEVWCNAYRFKLFLGCLDDVAPDIDRRRIDCSSKSADALVKLWLHKEESSAGTSTPHFGRERFATIVIGTSSICLFRPVSRWYHSIAIPSITVRADVFSGIVITAALAGMYFGTGSSSGPPSTLSLPPHASKNDDVNATDNVTLVDEDEISLSFSLSAEESEDVASAESSRYKDQKSRRNLTNPLRLNNSSESTNCWSEPPHRLFKVRGATYLQDRVKIESASPAFSCRGVELWLLASSDDMACRQIARHPAVLGGNLGAENTFLVNFLLPFGNLVAYFKVPEEDEMKPSVRKVWRRFINGDQAFRDSQLKLLPVLQEGPWIVQKAVGPGHSPALLGKVVPCQYYFCTDCSTSKSTSIYEVDVHISCSRVANAILNVVRGHTKGLRIAFAFILEGKEEDELPETVLCAFALNKVEIELCQPLPPLPSEDDGIEIS